MTREELERIRERVENATRGPWRATGDGGITFPLGNSGSYAPIVSFAEDEAFIVEDDAEFAAHAREDVPSLLAEVERLKAVIDKVLALATIHTRCEYISDCTRLSDVLSVLDATETQS